jgi:two-component system, NarL family, nitrate/nitrite response regulator NarL
MASPVTAIIVDDHPVVIEGVLAWIDRDPERRVHVVHTATGVDGIAEAPVADVIVLDLELGGRLVVDRIPGLAAAGHRIVAFSAHTGADFVLAVIEAGACAYVTKDEGPDHLVETIVSVAQDRPYVGRSHAKGMLADTRAERPALSAQERQALLLWFQGMSKASVGRRMSISENTVRQYIDRARVKYARLGRPAPTKDALLARAIEDRLITPADVGEYESYARNPAEPDR